MGYLSEVARRRIAAAVLVIGIIIAALAIFDIWPFSDPPTEAERAQAAVERFFDAGQAKDYKAACDELTNDAQRTMEQRAGATASQKGLKGCDQILALFLSNLRLGKVIDVRVSGNQAVVDASIEQTGSSHGKETSIGLFEIDDEWKIADFGGV
jgi:ketosteroid isomerase-like protein